MQKTRGRPKGSEKDDSEALSAMAEMIHADPTLKPTPAMRRYNAKIGEAEIRRLQVKWRERSEALLAAAVARTEARRQHAASPAVPTSRRKLGAVTEAAQTASAMYNLPEMHAMREFQNSPTARAMWEAQNSPAMRAILDAQSSPEMRAIREFHSSPTARAIEEAHRKINQMLGGW